MKNCKAFGEYEICETIEDGFLICRYYLKNGKKHNEHGPAELYFDKEGKVYIERYYIDGFKHREDGPSVVYYLNNQIVEEFYFLNDLDYSNDVIKYSKHLTIRTIVNAKNNLQKLKIFKLACILNDNKKLLDIIESQIIIHNLC